MFRRGTRLWRPLAAAIPCPVLFLSTSSTVSCQGSDSSTVPKSRPVLYVIRHGEAHHNVIPHEKSFPRRRDASLADPALTALGEQQAVKARLVLEEKLRTHQDESPQLLMSSTLRRALQTAESAVLPLTGEGAMLLSIDIACEIQFGDIWNEPLDPWDVTSSWPNWQVQFCRLWNHCGDPPLETADDMVRRVESVWAALCDAEEPVMVLVAHGCFLSFMLKRLACASPAAAAEADHLSLMDNAEVRRLHLPQFDGRSMTCQEMTAELERQGVPASSQWVDFWKRYGRRTMAIRRAPPGSPPPWSLREWRYSRTDEPFDADL